MNRIQHFIEPRRLLLSWQRPLAGKERRTRRIVGELERQGDLAVFRYLTGDDDFKKAQQEGFRGFPAFGIGKETAFTQGVVDAFARRLPPRKREDFSEYLERFRLPGDFAGSEFALLGYTGGKLPGDGFELVPDLEGVSPPFELVIEVAGFRHQDVQVDFIAPGESVRLVPELDNPVDREAIAIYHDAGRIGYVPRPFCRVFNQWITSRAIEARIDRINGKAERPLVYVFVSIA